MTNMTIMTVVMPKFTPSAIGIITRQGGVRFMPKQGRRIVRSMTVIVVENDRKYDRKWWVYQCAPSSETRGRRESHGNGCMRWNVRACRVSPPIQTKCRHCGNRGRKNAGQLVGPYPTRQDALNEVYRREYAISYTSNETEVIQ